MKRLVFLFLLRAMFLSGCESSYPCVNYWNSAYNFDSYNRKIAIASGYILNEGHSYDVVETDEGYDLVLHFVKKDGESND